MVSSLAWVASLLEDLVHDAHMVETVRSLRAGRGGLAVGFQLLSFFSSQYLNEATESSRRATVLSFKSLAGNLAYGAVGIGYAVAFHMAGGGTPPVSGSPAEEAVLASTLVWLPCALVALNIPLWLWGRRLGRMKEKPA